MFPVRLLSFFVLLLLVACGSPASGPRTAPMAPADWQSMVDQGVALAPVIGLQVVTGTRDAAAYFTDELFVVMQAALPGTPITSPDEVYARLDAAGPDAHSRIRSLRRRIVQQEPLSADEAAMLSNDLRERYLFIVFMHEGSEEGIHRTNLDDYDAFEYSMGVHRYPTDELHGRAAGFLIDLEAGREVWRHEVTYESEGLAAAEASSERIIERTRADAAFRLSEALSGAGSPVSPS